MCCVLMRCLLPSGGTLASYAGRIEACSNLSEDDKGSGKKFQMCLMLVQDLSGSETRPGTRRVIIRPFIEPHGPHGGLAHLHACAGPPSDWPPRRAIPLIWAKKHPCTHRELQPSRAWIGQRPGRAPVFQSGANGLVKLGGLKQLHLFINLSSRLDLPSTTGIPLPMAEMGFLTLVYSWIDLVDARYST